MGRSSRVFSLIERAMPGAATCGRMLVVSPPRRLLKGFLMETTTKKGRVYVWRVVTPLFRPLSGISLNYSMRVFDGAGVDVDPLDLPASAETIRKGVETEHVDYLRALRTIEDFSRHAFANVKAEPGAELPEVWLPTWIDFALTQFLLGNEGPAIGSLRRLDRKVDRMDDAHRLRMSPTIKTLLRTYDENPLDVVPLLDRWEAENIDRLRLQKAASAIGDDVG